MIGFYLVYGLQFYCLDQVSAIQKQEKTNLEQLKAAEATIQKLPVEERYNLSAIQYQKQDIREQATYLRGQYDAYQDAMRYSMIRTLISSYLFLALLIGFSIFSYRRMKTALQP